LLMQTRDNAGALSLVHGVFAGAASPKLAWEAPSIRERKNVTYNAAITGFSLTISNDVDHFTLEPAGTLATGTIVMPATAYDGFVVAIMSTQTITALTLNANTGQSIIGGVSTLTANQPVHYIYRASNTTWYRA
jgi:hypothetical protein